MAFGLIKKLFWKLRHKHVWQAMDNYDYHCVDPKCGKMVHSEKPPKGRMADGKKDSDDIPDSI